MTTAFAWIDGDFASPGEIANADIGPSKIPVPGQLSGTLHTTGERANQIYVSVSYEASETYAANYVGALDILIASDTRIRDGNVYLIGII